jgi:hypothetical protein
MTSKHEARAIHYEFLQLYRFSTCTGIISVDPTHVTQQQGIFGITNSHETLHSDISPITDPHPTLRGNYLRTKPHKTLQGDKSNSQTNQTIDIYFGLKLTPDEKVREYHDY